MSKHLDRALEFARCGQTQNALIMAAWHSERLAAIEAAQDMSQFDQISTADLAAVTGMVECHECQRWHRERAEHCPHCNTPTLPF